MMTDIATFALQLAPMRLRFGGPAAPAVAAELDALGLNRAVVLSTPGHADEARAFAADIGARVVGTVALARMHTPVEVTAAALAEVLAMRADALVSFGGGSVIGLGKALALRTGLPQIAVPTTYAGSEVTAILGQTEGGHKTTMTDARVQPEVIIYDPRLITGLPASITVTSGLNALAHAAEALYARDRNPLTTSLALQGIAAMVQSLPKIVADPPNLTARAQSQYGAFLCGLVLGQVGMSLHHKLCHTLGGSFDLPHAETHAVILPHAIAYNEAAVPDLLAPLASSLGHQNAAQGLYAFARSLGAPTSLKSLGLQEKDLKRAAEIATLNAYWNPRPVEKAALLTLLHAAWAGQEPSLGGYNG